MDQMCALVETSAPADAKEQGMLWLQPQRVWTRESQYLNNVKLLRVRCTNEKHSRVTVISIVKTLRL